MRSHIYEYLDECELDRQKYDVFVAPDQSLLTMHKLVRRPGEYTYN